MVNRNVTLWKKNAEHARNGVLEFAACLAVDLTLIFQISMKVSSNPLTKCNLYKIIYFFFWVHLKCVLQNGEEYLNIFF